MFHLSSKYICFISQTGALEKSPHIDSQHDRAASLWGEKQGGPALGKEEVTAALMRTTIESLWLILFSVFS
jgi:hypothetical protein